MPNVGCFLDKPDEKLREKAGEVYFYLLMLLFLGRLRLFVGFLVGALLLALGIALGVDAEFAAPLALAVGWRTTEVVRRTGWWKWLYRREERFLLELIYPSRRLRRFVRKLAASEPWVGKVWRSVGTV